MLALDSRTLLVVTTLISIGSAMALISLWRANSQRDGVGFWALGMSAVAIASLLISGRGNFPVFISLIVANSLYVIGFLLLLRGIRVFIARPPLLLLDICLFPLSAVLFYYFYYIDQNLAIRIAVLSSAFVITCGAIVYSLLSERTAPWRSAAYMVASVFALFGVSHGARAIIALLSHSDNSFLTSSTSSSLVFLSGIFFIGGIAITLILLMHAVLNSELQIFSHAVEQCASSIIITNIEGSICYANPAASNKTGYSRKELVGQNPRILQSGKMLENEYATLWQTIVAGGTWRGEFHNRKKNGDLFWEIASIAPVKQQTGKISHFVAVKEDITALKQAKEQISHLANHDTLTGLPTRSLFTERLLEALIDAKHFDTKVAVFFVDLDGFKAINDNYGHDFGDRILKEMASRVRDCVGVGNTLARIGGDEFLVLLSNVVDQNAITLIAGRILQSVAKPYEVEKEQAYISASIGIAIYPEDGLLPQNLISKADEAMYKIKRQGKNNYTFCRH
ncbi:diguanylate cyclase domain-containing protein [Vibrio sp. VB16]|uniref:diguanylate cyclase domain-containing protein n=1 Tax=Vibrio sp. VB16 TaxID=2785746 RepID=UPI00189F0B28|nr:diguanylate cyclase [Vibrio sp. VB16]UGA57505.1 diguanylate cyclase [Vibrio sp. VB16]